MRDEDGNLLEPGVIGVTPWMPMVMTPDHPNYHDLDEYIQTRPGGLVLTTGSAAQEQVTEPRQPGSSLVADPAAEDLDADSPSSSLFEQPVDGSQVRSRGCSRAGQRLFLQLPAPTASGSDRPHVGRPTSRPAPASYYPRFGRVPRRTWPRPARPRRCNANVAALRLLRHLQDEDRPGRRPTSRRVLARWSGWGSVPKVFDDADEQFAAAAGRAAHDAQRARVARRVARPPSTPTTPTPRSPRRCGTPSASNGFGRHHERGRLAAAHARTRLRRRHHSWDWRPDAAREKDAAVFGVELDPTTAAIAAAPIPACPDPGRVLRRHPHPARLLSTWSSATSRSATSLCTTKPTTPADTRLHNHFILKSLGVDPPRRGRRGPDQPLHDGRRTTRPLAARSPPWPTWSPRSACQCPAPTRRPPAPRSSPTCSSCAAATPPTGRATPVAVGEHRRRLAATSNARCWINRYFAEHHPDRVIGDDRHPLRAVRSRARGHRRPAIVDVAARAA